MKTVLFTLLFFISSFAAGQRTTGEIKGTVFDPASALIPGVALQAKDLATGETRDAISDERGGFVFLNLQSGVYELTAALAGFQTAVLSPRRRRDCADDRRRRPSDSRGAIAVG